MKTLRQNYIDILAFLIIGSQIFYPHNAIIIVIWFYSSLLLISKLVGLAVPSLVQRVSKDDETPSIFYHVIYLLISATLFFTREYYLAGFWILIWFLSWFSLARMNKMKPSQSKSKGSPKK